MSPKTFKPAWWLRNGHLQTLWPALMRRKVKLVTKRQRLELPDGDFIDLDWVGEKGPIVLILPGLEGSIRSSYVRGMACELCKKNMRAVVMHYRGCSGSPNRLPRAYHSGDTDDLNYVVQHINEAHNNELTATIGFSIGGNILLKWLGEQGKNAPVKSAVAVCVPFDLSATSDTLNRGVSKIYRRYMLKSILKRMRDKIDDWPSHLGITVKRLKSFRDFRSFDDCVTSRMHGFRDVDDYYNRSSCIHVLDKIAIPTLVIHSENDPFMPRKMELPKKKSSSDIQWEIYRSGGHLGFVSGHWPWRCKYHIEHRIMDFFLNDSPVASKP